MWKLFVKAALSVFICCLLYEYTDLGTGVPFYSGIAAIICLQPQVQSTFRMGMTRTVGTLIGGFTGMGVLFLIREFSIFRFSSFKYLIISLCIIPLMSFAELFRQTPLLDIMKNKEKDHALTLTPLIYIADFMRKNSLTSITCIAFLSVTITHGNDSSIDSFALNRMLDTLIGVFVSFFVNYLPLGSRTPATDNHTQASQKTGSASSNTE